MLPDAALARASRVMPNPDPPAVLGWPPTDDWPSLLQERGALQIRGVPLDADNRSLRSLGDRLGQPSLRALEPSLHEGRGVQRVQAAVSPVLDRFGKLLKSAGHAEFALHTDESFFDRPARFVLLHCWQPAPAGGVTRIADSRAIAGSVDRIEWIAWTQLRLPYPCGDRCSLDDGLLRFNAAECSSAPLAPVQRYWLGRFAESAQQLAIELALAGGDLIALDNHRMLHGRTAFHSDSRRVLKRLRIR